MKIPKKIKIAGREYKVYINKQVCEDQKMIGMAMADDSTIILKGPVDDESMKVTFLHECLHLVNVILQHQGTKMDSEHYVNPVAELLYQIIKQIEE